MGEGNRLETELVASLKVMVMGAGAIGSLVGAFLSKVGVEVAFVGRRENVKAILDRGLIVEGPLGNFTVKAEAYESLHEARGSFDLVLITVKAYDTAEAARQVKKVVEEGAKPLCLQNGLGVEVEASRILGVEVFRGITNNGAMLLRPGVVLHTGLGDTLIGGSGPVIEEFVAKLNASGLRAERVDNVEEVVWIKTLVNSGINALGAITGLRNGELIEREGLKVLMRKVVEEGMEVARMLGLKFTIDPIELTFKVARATANNKNSMLQDLEKGGRTEIDYINGAIVSMAKEFGMKVPLNEALTRLVKAMEREG